MIGKAVEARVFGFLRGVGLDLAHAGDVIVQQRVEIGGGVALVAVAVAALGRVDPRAKGEEGHRQRGPCRHGGIEEKQKHADAQHLQRGDQALLDAVDEHALHVGDVLDDAGHDISGAAGVEPAQRQALDFRIEVRADVIDDFLLEDVVDVDAQRVEAVLGEEAEERDADPEGKFVMPPRDSE